jgi:hypothetical protein
MKLTATIFLADFLAGLSATIAPCVAAERFQVEEATIAGIHQALHDKTLTCRQLVEAYLDRIEAYDRKGPAFNAILTPPTCRPLAVRSRWLEHNLRLTPSWLPSCAKPARSFLASRTCMNSHWVA